MRALCRNAGTGPLFAILFLGLLLVQAPTVLGDDPLDSVVSQCDATEGGFALFPVARSEEKEFINQMVHNGPFHGRVPGFVNEKILRVEPSKGSNTVLYLVMTRNYSPFALKKVESKRLESVKSSLAGEPIIFSARMIEHQLADWGWERGGDVSFTRVSTHEEVGLEVIDDYGTSLAFFKSGYSGQMGQFQFFPTGTSIDEVRASLSRFRGLAGATIFRRHDDNTYFVYAEYFNTPRVARKPLLSMKRGDLLQGTHTGVVVQNYDGR